MIPLIVYFLLLWLVASAPAFNFPLSPELCGMGVSLLLVRQALIKPSRDPSGGMPRKREIKLILLLVIGGFALLAIRASTGFFANDAYQKTCGLMPGIMQKLECISQAGVDQDYAFRQLLYDANALGLFIAALFATVFISSSAIPIALIAVTGLFSGFSLVCQFFHIDPLPSYIMSNEFGFERMTYLMQNPTWIWPYLAPGMLSAISLLPKSPGAKKAIIAILLILMFTVCLGTQERGALVFIIAVAGGVVSFLIFEKAPLKFRYRDSKRGLALTFACFGFGALLLLLSYPLLAYLAHGLGLGGRLQASSIESGARLLIWKAAWHGIRDNPFLGHGYASWHSAFAPYARPVHAKVLDTAHNYFMQTAFELGIPETLLHLMILTALLKCSYKLAADKHRQFRAIFITCIAYLPILLVQEFNFIRPTYYAHAVYFGWLAAGGAGSNQLAISRKSRCESIPLRRRWCGYLLICFSFASMVSAAVCLLAFSTSGYQYEAETTRGFSPRLRWLRGEGTVTFIRHINEEGPIYAVYKIQKAIAKAYSIRSGIESRFDTYQIRDHENYLVVPARSILALPDWLNIPATTEDYGRSIGMLVAWPPVLTKLPVTWSAGLYDWEKIPGTLWAQRWCSDDCSVTFRSCSGRLKLTFVAARPDIRSERPLVIQARLTHGSTEVPLSDLKFTQPNEQTAIFVPHNRGIRLITTNTYTPGNGDKRQLSVLFQSAYCEK